jgi:hypothetical protein
VVTRRLTHAEALDSWRVDGELAGGHRPSETLAFISALEDADEQCALPAAYVPGDHEPRWRTRINRWLGR